MRPPLDTNDNVSQKQSSETESVPTSTYSEMEKNVVVRACTGLTLLPVLETNKPNDSNNKTVLHLFTGCNAEGVMFGK